MRFGSNKVITEVRTFNYMPHTEKLEWMTAIRMKSMKSLSKGEREREFFFIYQSKRHQYVPERRAGAEGTLSVFTGTPSLFGRTQIKDA